MKVRRVLFFVLALVVGFVLYTQGYVLGVSLLTKTGLPLPTLLERPTPHPLTDALSALVVVLGAAVIAPSFRGGFLSRWALLALFLFILGHLISALEAAFFTKFGGTRFLIALGVLPSLLGSLGVTLFSKTPGPVEPFLQRAKDFWGEREVRDWTWRVAVAWLSFPVIYLLFGSLVAPFVEPYYRSLDFLDLPSWGTLVPLQLGRSLLILAAVLPLFLSWKGSRVGLVLAFSWAFYALTGLSGLLGGHFLPDVLRWVHGLETLADAVAYAWVMTFLFGKEGRRN